MKFNEAIERVVKQARREHKKRGDNSMGSIHGGWALIHEEMEEAFEAIRANDKKHLREEITQVASTAIRFLAQI